MTLSPKTPVNLTLAVIFTLGIALVGTTWRAANALNDMRNEVARSVDTLSLEVGNLRRELRSVAADRWDVGSMERWAYRLERENRERSLSVPDVRAVWSERAGPATDLPSLR